MPMTQTTTTTDPRPIFGQALATASDAVAAVSPDQLGDPTPCSEFAVRDLLEHLVGVLDRVTTIGQGGDPFAVARRDVPDGGWVEAWHDAAGALQAVWADDRALGVPSPLPWAPGTGADVLRSYVSELTVHTWDLATATAQHAAWDADVLELVADGIGGVMPATDRAALFAEIKKGLPGDYASAPDPFVDAVPVPDDAPLIDRIVAWNGRQP